MDLGSWIKGWREFLGLTQKELASEVGVSRQTVCSWESEGSQPSDANLDRMVTVFGCPVPKRPPAPLLPAPPTRRAS